MSERVSCTSCRQPRPVADYVAVVYALEGGEWLAQLCAACYARPAVRERFALRFWGGDYGAAVALGWSHPQDDGSSAIYYIYREPTDRRLLELFVAARPMRRRSRRGADHRRA